MLRSFGWKAALLTLVGDLGKTAISIFIAGVFFGFQYVAGISVSEFCYVAGAAAVLGHVFPVYYKFKGGKGVVTAYASILMCDPVVFLILFIIFVIIVAFTKYISLGSVMCMLLYPVILDRMHRLVNGATGAYVIIAIFNAALIIFMHRENIKRLIKGKENKFSFKKSEKKDKENTK
jgi:glycerol-3-phosphate acyltransferase PlsY